MIKYFCEKCGKEIPKDERLGCEIHIRKLTLSTDRIDCDFCQECISSIIGRDRFIELVTRYEERRMRAEERRKKGGAE